MQAEGSGVGGPRPAAGCRDCGGSTVNAHFFSGERGFSLIQSKKMVLVLLSFALKSGFRNSFGEKLSFARVRVVLSFF